MALRCFGAWRGYRTLRVIGRGSFGRALLVEDRDGLQRVMKVVDLERGSEQRRREAPMEAELMQRLNHPNIARFHESFHEEGSFVIVMDYSDGGDLKHQVRSARAQKRHLAEPLLLRWLSQAFLGLKHMHRLNIIHRDLKSENLFLDADLQHLCIGDLGIACALTPPATVRLESHVVGTPYYLSPETCSMGIHSKASDLWAMGCVIYELATLKLPFYAPTLQELLQSIARQRAPPLPSRFSTSMAEVYGALMSQNRNKRPSCKELLSVPPFVQVWDVGEEDDVDSVISADRVIEKAPSSNREAGSAAALRRIQELRRQAETGCRPSLPEGLGAGQATQEPDHYRGPANGYHEGLQPLDRPHTPRIPGDCQELLQRRPWSSKRPASAHRGATKLMPLKDMSIAAADTRSRDQVTHTVLNRRLTAAGRSDASRQAKRKEAEDVDHSASQSVVRSRAVIRSESEPPMERVGPRGCARLE